MGAAWDAFDSPAEVRRGTVAPGADWRPSRRGAREPTMSHARRRPRLRERPGIVVTGGGTAGHVLPALSIAHALLDLGYDREDVHFVGARRGMEAELVPAAGFAITLLSGRGIARRLTLDNLTAAAGLVRGFATAARLLARLRPGVVVTVGGFAGVPASLAAVIWRIPVVVVNLDAVPGAANRLVGRFAALSAVAFAGTPLPRAVVTGAPVRPEVLAASRSVAGRLAARAELGLDEHAFVVAVTGGSLGARRLNLAAPALAARLSTGVGVGAPSAGGAGQPGTVVYHVSGERDHEAARTAGAGLDSSTYRLVAYERRLPVLLAACDLLVARAGASTVAEVTVLGVPSVLVPLPGAPSDHQRRNAETLARVGAALVVDDAGCDGERLAGIVEDLRSDPARLTAMGEAAASLGRPDAAAAVARLVDALARGSQR